MAAADALASRYAGPGMTAQAAQPAQGPSAYIPKDTGGYGLLDKGYRHRRAAMMDAQQMKPGARTALAALLKEQSAQGDREAQAEQNAADRGFRQGENALDRGLKSQELMARMDDSAATRQLRAQELQDNMATNAVKRDALGVETGAARQLADLRIEYLTAATPEERNSAAQKLSLFSGSPVARQPAPAGYRWTPDGQKMEAVPGGPADIKAGELGVKRDRQQQASINQANRVIDMTKKAESQTSALSAGFVGSLVKGLPGSTARDLSSNLDTIRANLGFAELQAMRDASPTGGALGAIAVQELTALQSTVASLDQSQSPEQLRKNLQTVGEHYQRWKNAVELARNEESGPGTKTEDQKTTQQPATVTSDEQWTQLPVGSIYTAPDGSIRRKK